MAETEAQAAADLAQHEALTSNDPTKRAVFREKLVRHVRRALQLVGACR